MLICKPRRSIANIGVVIGQSTQLLYPGPAQLARATTTCTRQRRASMTRCSAAASHLTLCTKTGSNPNGSANIARCLLPNVAMLSDRQCQQIREYVRAGGSLMASFETSLYDENLKPRQEFRTRRSARHQQSRRRHRHQRQCILRPHRTDQPHPDPRRLHRHQLAPRRAKSHSPQARPEPCAHRRSRLCALSAGARLSAVSHTDEPAVVLREVGASRIAYFPGDIERTYWLTGHGDLLRLLHNTIRWITHRRSHRPRRWRWLHRIVRLGNSPRLRHSPAQLHQSQCAPWLAERRPIRSVRRPSA